MQRELAHVPRSAPTIMFRSTVGRPCGGTRRMLYDTQEDARGPIWFYSLLLPLLDGSFTEAKPRRKLTLRQTQLLPNSFDVRYACVEMPAELESCPV